MVNKDRLKKWVTALRSGKYEQAREILRDDDGHFCCLGVACMVYQEEATDGVMAPGSENWRENSYMPQTVQEWFGVDSRNPFLGLKTAACMNDSFCNTFEEIADAIETEFKLQD